MKKRSILILTLLASSCIVSSADSNQRDDINIKYRTFGHGLQVRLGLEQTEKPISVMHNQFSTPDSYAGNKKMRFDRYMPPEVSANSTDGDHQSNAVMQQSALHEVRPQFFAEANIPAGIREALLIFRNGTNGHEVIVFNDALARTDERNIHFYNLASTPLIVRTFNQIKHINPLEQARWDISQEDSDSLIQVAVTDPLTKLVYETRYRLRDGQRIVFFATQQNTPASAENANLKIESHLQPIYNLQQEELQ